MSILLPSVILRYSKAEQKTAVVKLEDMIKLQKKAQDQMKRLVRDMDISMEMEQCVKYNRNVDWNCFFHFTV